MNKIARAFAVAALLVAASGANAQETSTKVGLGVGFTALNATSSVDGNLNPVSFYIPIYMGAIRIEPELGYFKSNVDHGSSDRQFSLGVGAFYAFKQVEQTAFYGGGRLGFVFEGSEPAVGNSTSGVDFRFALAAGGEHSIAPSFSVGAEAQVGLVRRGEQKEAGVTIVNSTVTTQTAGVIFLRYFFM